MKDIVYECDVTERRISRTKAPAEWAMLGGRALTSTIVSESVPPKADPLGRENLLVFAPGLLSGTVLSSSNRLSAGCLSPLTKTIKESNSGGTAAYRLSRCKVKALIVRGMPQNGNPLSGIRIHKDGADFVDLKELKGKGTYETAEYIRGRFGRKVSIILIGQAGELLLPTACISITDPEGEPCRNLGRGGLGAVLGSKGIKAIIIDDEGTDNDRTNAEEAKAFIKKFAGELRAHPVTGEKFAKYGTSMTLLNVNGLGGLPTRNFSSGVFKRADKIGAESLYEIITLRGGQHAHRCMPGCVIQCSNKYVDKDGRPVVGSLDYETICLLGSNLGVDDLDAIADWNYLCNDYGVDTMETGVALGVLAEAGVFSFGDVKKIRELICEIPTGSEMGTLLASGSTACGKRYNVSRVPAVKGQGMAAYDPRVIKGMGITYAMTPMGADHTAGNAITLSVDHLKPEGLLEPVQELHRKTMVLDSLGFCIFTGRVTLGNTALIEEAVKVLAGVEVTFQDLMDKAEKWLQMERDFNKRAGFTKQDDRLPSFMYTEALSPQKTVFDVSEKDMDRFYSE